MRTLIGYPTGLGIVIALAGMPLTDIGLVESGERIRSIAVTEFFNPQMYLGSGLALPTWLIIAAIIVALILTAQNSTSAERPKSAIVLITYLVAALTVCFPAVVLFGAAGLVNDNNGLLGPGPALLLIGSASIAIACALSLGAARDRKLVAEVEGE